MSSGLLTTLATLFPTPAKARPQLHRFTVAGADLSSQAHRIWAPACAGVGRDRRRRVDFRTEEAGFTLVELMVALLIFAILASAGVALLSFSVRAQAASNAKLDDLAALQRTLSLLSADLAQASDRPVRDEAGTVLPAFAGENGGGTAPMLRFVRNGWINLDTQPRADTQRVAYRVIDGTLERLAWPRLDGAAPLPPQPLLTKVQGIAVRYRYKGAWNDRWDGAGGVPLPQAMELRVRRTGVDYRQLFLIGTGYAPTPQRPVGAAG